MNVGTDIWQKIWQKNIRIIQSVSHFDRKTTIEIRQSFFVDILIIPIPDPISKI